MALLSPHNFGALDHTVSYRKFPFYSFLPPLKFSLPGFLTLHYSQKELLSPCLPERAPLWGFPVILDWNFSWISCFLLHYFVVFQNTFQLTCSVKIYGRQIWGLTYLKMSLFCGNTRLKEHSIKCLKMSYVQQVFKDIE